MDFVLGAAVAPVAFGVVAVVAPLPDAAADPEAVDGDSDEAGGVAADDDVDPAPAVWCFDFCDVSFSFWSSNITCLKYSIGGT